MKTSSAKDKVPTQKDMEEAKKFFNLKKHLETPYDKNGRVCSCCEKYKEWECFKSHTRSSVGRSAKCKECYKEERKVKGRKKERYSRKKSMRRLKKSDPYLHKARTLRNRLLSRGNKAGRSKEETPTATELVSWFKSLEPHSCYYSGEPVKLMECHIDHKQPLNRGGSNKLDNLCITSAKMNSSKGAMSEEEFKQLLKLVDTWEDNGEYILSRLRMGYFGKLK